MVTLNSYRNRLVWLLTGNYAKPGANNTFVPLLGLSRSSRDRVKSSAAERRSPVTNRRSSWD